MKKALKIICVALLAIVLLVLGYVAYVLIDYHRIDDNLSLEVTEAVEDAAAKTDTEYKLVSYNIGFGAYEADYSFFMDGGTESWAWSEDRLQSNMAKIAELLKTQQADFLFLEEVDRDSTRSYHVDESKILQDALPGYDSVWCQNFDSPFLFYPLTQPHGASVSGLLTYSTLPITASVRHSLPVEKSLMRMLDLDRCYSVSRVPLENGKELLLYCVHLSAYTSDGTIATQQAELLLSDMQSEYEKGNYCICGGDFNKDLLGNSDEIFGVDGSNYTWAQPLPVELFEGRNMTLIAPLNPDRPVPSCRNADAAYHPGQYVVTVDGFIVSDNVAVQNADVIDTGFAYSDHNPVQMLFKLLP